MIHSLQGKLTSGLLLSLIAAFIALWVFVNLSVRYLTEDYIYTRLAHDTDGLLASIVKDSPDFEIDASSLGRLYHLPFSGHYFELTREDDVIRSRSLWDQVLKYPSSQTSQELRLTQTGPQQQPLLMLVSHFSKDQRLITVMVAEDFSPVDQAIGVFWLRFTLSTVVILIILVALQILVLRRGLKPLNQLQKDLGDLEKGLICSIDTSVPSELTPLVNEINHLHEALEYRLVRHRNALSDLAHALKKPLTVIQQLSQDEKLNELPEIKGALQRQATTTRKLTQRILNRARLTCAEETGKPFDLEKDLSGLLETLHMMHRGKQVNVSLVCDTTIQCRCDREDMLELLGNLLDNAFKWCESIVLVTISHNTDFLVVIEDDGPGVPADSLKTIFQRGQRLDETLNGQGLGLAITSDIVQHYKGSITPSISGALGGLQIDIRLPF